MGKFWRILFVVALLSCLGLAQVKSTFQLKCDKPSDQHSIETVTCDCRNISISLTDL